MNPPVNLDQTEATYEHCVAHDILTCQHYAYQTQCVPWLQPKEAILDYTPPIIVLKLIHVTNDSILTDILVHDMFLKIKKKVFPWIKYS